MYRSFIEGRLREAKEAYEKHIENITDQSERIKAKAIYLHLNYTRGGAPEALIQLEQLFSDLHEADTKEEVAFWLAWSYSSTRDFDSELELWRGMLASADAEEQKARFASQIATTLNALEKRAEAKAILTSHLQEATSPKATRTLYKTLADLEKEDGDLFVAAIAAEKVAQLSPNDSDNLFSAAHAQSNCELNYISFMNYDTILRLKSDAAMACNNIGVQASELGMAGQSVRYYRKAKELGNTLAMANIAYLLLNKGFLEEAEDIIRKALTQSDHHPNVASALAELERIKQKEEEILDKVLALGTRQREFIRAYADARFSRLLGREAVAGVWKSEGGADAKLEIDKNTLAGSWEERNIGLLESIGRWKLKAVFVNAALSGTIACEPKESGGLLSYRFPSSRSFVGFITENGAELRVMFRDKEEPMFCVFTKAG